MSQKITFNSQDGLVSIEIEIFSIEHVEKLLDWFKQTNGRLPIICPKPGTDISQITKLTFDTAQQVLEALVHVCITIPLYEAKVDCDTINPKSSD